MSKTYVCYDCGSKVSVLEDHVCKRLNYWLHWRIDALVLVVMILLAQLFLSVVSSIGFMWGMTIVFLVSVVVYDLLGRFLGRH